MTADLNQIYGLLVDIKGEVGSLRAEVKSVDEKLDSHVIDDKLVEMRVRKLEDGANKARGAMAVVSLVGGVAGAFVGKWLGLHP